MATLTIVEELKMTNDFYLTTMDFWRTFVSHDSPKLLRICVCDRA